MNKEMKYAFIASSKVIRHKINPKAADILATLMYKHKYWEDIGGLISFKGRIGFFMSHDDISEETSFKKGVIQSNIALLKKEGLIDTAQQGLNKPNFYFLDEGKILKYIKVHEADYEKWRLKIRSKKTAVTPMPIMKTLKPISGSAKTSIQEVAKSPTTKNKSTKNKNTKNLTNHINAEKIEGLIEDIKNAIDDDDKSSSIDALYEFLCDAVPRFKGFKMSRADFKLMDEIGDSKINSFKIADKIISNSEKILNNSKESRFGNLFVGLKEMNDEFNLRYG